MRTWKLSAGDPLQLSLAADADLDPVDHANHVIWEVSLGQGDPAAAFDDDHHLAAGLNVRDGRITRIDEYMDSSKFAAWMGGAR